MLLALIGQDLIRKNQKEKNTKGLHLNIFLRNFATGCKVICVCGQCKSLAVACHLFWKLKKLLWAKLSSTHMLHENHVAAHNSDLDL